MKDSEFVDEVQFSQFIWARHRWFRILFHIPLLLTSKDYRAFRFLKLSKVKRTKKAEKWLKKFRKDPRYPRVTLDQVVGRDDVVSLLIDSIDYHILRLQDNDQQFAKMYTAPPPKVFILESDPGWGKKFLAKAIQRESLERSVKEGIKAVPETLKSSDISSWLMGVSEKQLENRMNSIFSTPTVLFIEQAQAFSEKPQGLIGDIDRESQRIGEALERSLERLKENPIRAIAILSTNNFANMPETLRLIAERINLNGMKEEDIIEICRRRSEESGIDIEPKKLFQALSQALRTVGKIELTPSDINKAFILSTNKVQAPFREAVRKRVRGKVIGEPPKPTIEDFISVAPDVAAYTEEEVSTMV
ncbi:MAG: AAA family ATPase, partial [Nitrososphaerales archaeon]